MKALILGGGGQLASDLQALLGDQARSFSHAEVDICDRDAVDRAYDAVQPELVFNCAAFHNVDVCEQDRTSAWRVNVEAVQDLAKRSVPLVHISSNYVFDGRREEPYSEDDLPSPRSVYALTKLAGEHAALAYGKHVLVVRSAGLYGMHGSTSKGGNFVERMLARAREQGSLRMVADQRLQPTFTADLAAGILEAVEARIDGVVHLTASGECSWFEFTRAIMQVAGLDVPIEPVSTVVGRGGADRPLNGLLACTRADRLQLQALRPWHDALVDYMTRAGIAANGSRRRTG